MKAKEAKKGRSSVRSNEFAAKFEHKLSFARALLTIFTEESWVPDWIRMRMCGQIRFEYATYGRANFQIRSKKFMDSRVSGYVWTGPQAILARYLTNLRPIENFDRTFCSHGTVRIFSFWTDPNKFNFSRWSCHLPTRRGLLYEIQTSIRVTTPLPYKSVDSQGVHTALVKFSTVPASILEVQFLNG